MRRRVVMEDLGNMNPGELEPRPWNGGDTDFTNDTTVGSLPEKECMKARMAAFQAIMEEVVDNAVDEAPADATPAEVASNVYQTTDEITDKAVALHLVPAGMHGLVRKLVAYKLRPRNSRAKLYARAAHLCAEAVTTDSNDPAYNAGTPAIDTPLEESPSADDLVSTATSAEDESPADGTSPTTAWWNMEGDTPVETPADDSATPAEGDPENPSDTPTESSDAVTPSDVVVDEGVDQDTASEMKYLITTACHHRRATSKVSRRFSGKIVNQMLHELRYKLPDSFLRKYGID